MDHQKILRIVLLGGLGKIEGPRYHCLSIDDHHLVMRNGVGYVYAGWDSRVGEEISGRVLRAALAFVEDDLNLEAPLVGVHDGFGNWSGCKRIGLNEDGGLGFV